MEPVTTGSDWEFSLDWRTWGFGFGYQRLSWMSGAYFSFGPLNLSYANIYPE